MTSFIHPSLFFFLGAALLPFIRGKGQSAIRIGLPLLAFLSLLIAPEGNHGILSLGGYELIFGRVDRLSLLFGYIFTFMAVVGMIYSLHVKNEGERIAAFLYIGSALGALFAGDLITLFLFWEIMAFSSVFLIWFGKDPETAVPTHNPKAGPAGFRYLMVHIFGGLLLLGGIVLYAAQGGSIAFATLPKEGLAGWLILLGFLVNAAAPPLHAWLPDAYPEATVTGTIFLATFTTKTAVYVLARGYSGMQILAWWGAIMALYGVSYTLLENNPRRLLSYHIISQVGYMIAGIGIGSELAVNGAVAHAFNNILYKGLLMMGMSAVFYMTGRRKGTELGGLYKDMPITFILYMIAGFSISGFPFFAGFISKAMIISAAAEAHLGGIWLILMAAAAGTFLSTTLKLPYVVFFGEKKVEAKDPPKHMLAAMGLSAAGCILVGVAPGLLYRILPFPVDYHAYTVEHIVQTVQLLLAAAVGFVFLLHKLHPENTVSLDFDYFYRKGAPLFMWLANHPIAKYEQAVTEAYRFVLIEPAKKLASIAWNFDIWVVDGLVNASGWFTLLESRISEIFDVYVVDGTVNGVSTTLDAGARTLRRLQTGAIQNYILAMVLGIVVLAVIFMF